VIPEGFDVNLVPLVKEDYDDFYADLSFIDEFPLPELTGSLLQKKYSTWDEYKKCKDPSTLPERCPPTWNPIDDEMNLNTARDMYTNLYVDLPRTGYVRLIFICC
jgi:hypothetical protein